MSFRFNLCLYELGLSVSNIKTNFHLSSAASVLKDVSNVSPQLRCELSVVLGHYLIGDWDCRNFKEILPDKKQRVLPYSYNPMFFTTSAKLDPI